MRVLHLKKMHFKRKNKIKKYIIFVYTAKFQGFYHHIFHKKNMLHLSHILKRKFDIVTGLQLSVGI